VLAPRSALSQTLLSLISNAFDASDIGTPVIVDVSTGSDLLRIAVSDHGHGLSPESMKRAGEPFFTTKEPGRGLGLGLFLARVFAERAGGSLRLESGAGTTAILELPTKGAWVEPL
jgi:two-component system sensor histidine kinase RegB